LAAAVILPPDFDLPGLDDSKKLRESTRLKLESGIKEQAISWAVAECSPAEIDQFNILNASILAMHRALDQLEVRPGLILVDGNRFKNYPFVPHRCFVKGDSRFASIAAASILAKNERDRVMKQLANQYPGYGWERNMAYPTEEHRLAIRRLGLSAEHRRTFKLRNP
jgi:ribonuclease HII